LMRERERQLLWVVGERAKKKRSGRGLAAKKRVILGGKKDEFNDFTKRDGGNLNRQRQESQN